MNTEQLIRSIKSNKMAGLFQINSAANLLACQLEDSIALVWRNGKMYAVNRAAYIKHNGGKVA